MNGRPQVGKFEFAQFNADSEPGIGTGSSVGHGTGAWVVSAACWHSCHSLAVIGVSGTPSMIVALTWGTGVLGKEPWLPVSWRSIRRAPAPPTRGHHRDV